MLKNCYADIIEPWKVELIVRRARRWGIGCSDLEDVQQEIVLSLLDFVFDTEKSAGASEVTAVTAVIDRRLAMMRRRETRHLRREQRFRAIAVVVDEVLRVTPNALLDEDDRNLAIDLRTVIDELSPRARRVCEYLSEGRTLNEIAGLLSIDWRAVRREVDAIRLHLQQSGLGAMTAETWQAEIAS